MLPPLVAGNIPVSRGGAGGSPVTSRISCSLRVSRATKASASASSCLRCALRETLGLVVALADDLEHLGIDV